MELAIRQEINMLRERARQIENHLNAHAAEMDDRSVRFWEASARHDRALAKVLAQLSRPGPDPDMPGPGRPAKVQP